MFKTPITVQLYKEFLSNYQSFPFNPSPIQKPFVFVDGSDIKLLTNMVDEFPVESGEVFAVGVAGDGYMEILSLDY